MTARLLGIVVLMVLTSCASHVPVRREVPRVTPAPIVRPPAPVAVIPPQPEPQPSLPAPVIEEPLPPVIPLPDKPPAPATPVTSLLASVQAAVAAGKLDQGAALSERALRISPRDAQLWYQLAVIRSRQNRIDAAADAAKRALSLANKDPILLQQINSLLQELAAKAPQ